MTDSCPASTPTLKVSERGQKLRRRQPQLVQDAGESHAVEQTEREDQRQPPRLEVAA